MKRRLFSLFVLAFSFLTGFAQENAKRGLSYLDDLQFHKARNFFQDQVKASPADVRSYCWLGDAYLGLQKTDSAMQMYQKAATVDPKSPFPLIGLGKIALLKGEKQNETDLFEKARKADRKNPEVYCEIANGCFGLTKTDTATGNNYLKLGLDLNSKYAPFHVAFGDYESLGHRFGNSVNAYERAIFYDANYALAYRKLGVIQTLARSYRDGINSLAKSIELNVDQVLAYKNLGDLYYLIGKYTEAEKNYEIYMAKAEFTPDDTERYAIILFFNKKHGEASKLLEKVMGAQNSEEPVLLRIRGYIAFETGEYAKGIEYMQKFFKLHDPEKNIASDFIYYGRLLQKSGKDTLAIENYKKGLLLDSTKTELYDELAKLYTVNKMHIQAVANYKKMLDIGADKVNTWFKIGKEYYFEGDIYRLKYEDSYKLQIENKIPFTDSIAVMQSKRTYYQLADSAFTMVTVLSPQYPGGYLWKGRMESSLDPEAETDFAKNSYEKAAALIEAGDSTKSRGSLIESYHYLASYYFLNGERLVKSDKAQSVALKEKAMEYWRKILAIDPKDAKTLEVFDKLKIKP